MGTTATATNQRFESDSSRQLESKRSADLREKLEGLESRSRLAEQESVVKSPTMARESILLSEFPTFEREKREEAEPAAQRQLSGNKTLVQEWEGIVEYIDDRTFRGAMRPVLGERQSLEFSEFGDFDISQLSQKDQKRLQPGVRFRWAIGIERQGSNPYQYQRLYIPVFASLSEADLGRLESDAKWFGKLFKAK